MQNTHTPEYHPTVGQLAQAEELLGVDRFNQLCAMEEVNVTQNELLVLYQIVSGKTREQVIDTPMEEARAAITFFFSVSLARSKRVTESYPIFLLLSMTPEQMELAVSRASSIFPGLENEAGAALDTLLQRLREIISTSST